MADNGKKDVTGIKKIDAVKSEPKDGKVMQKPAKVDGKPPAKSTPAKKGDSIP